jgi:hypothetical protein
VAGDGFALTGAAILTARALKTARLTAGGSSATTAATLLLGARGRLRLCVRRGLVVCVHLVGFDDAVRFSGLRRGELLDGDDGFRRGLNRAGLFG